MKLKTLSLGFITCITFASCSVDLNGANGSKGANGTTYLGSGEKVVASNNIIEEVRNLQNFEGLDVSSAIIVNITDADYKGTVKVSAPDNILTQIITRVDNGILKIYTEGSIQLGSGQKLEITIPHKKLRSFDITGASSVNVKHQLKVEKMDVKLSGASKLDLNVMSNDLKADNSGASKFSVKGNVQKAKLMVSGASKVDAEDLKVSSANVEASGASKVSVWAVDQLTVSASGASKVEYKAQSNLLTSLDKSGASKISEI